MASHITNESKVLVDTGDVELELPPDTTLGRPKDDKEGHVGGLAGQVDLGRGSLVALLKGKTWGYWNNRTACWLTVLVSITSSRRCRIQEAKVECYLGDPRNDETANKPSLEERLHPRFAKIHPTLATDPDPTIVGNSSSWSLAPKIDMSGIAAIEGGSREGSRTWESKEGWTFTGELLREDMYEHSKARFIACQNEALQKGLTNEVTVNMIVEYKEKLPFYIDFELSATLNFQDSYIRTLGKHKRAECRRRFVPTE